MIHNCLDLCTGICWSTAYVIAIVRGLKFKTWCIPAISICLNLSWEFWVVAERIASGAKPNIPFYIQISWLLLDIGIFVTWALHGKRENHSLLEKALLLCTALVFMYFTVYRAGYYEEVSFVIDLIMSILFCHRLLKDKGEWISIHIAVAKLVGSLASTVLSGIVYRDLLILWLGGLCFIFNSFYLGHICKIRGKNETKKQHKTE